MGGIVFNCVSLHCLILYYFVWHCITLSGIVLHFGGIVLNSVSLYCLVLQLLDRPDQPTMCVIVLHVGVYCIESCVIALSGTAAAGSLGSAYNV